MVNTATSSFHVIVTTLIGMVVTGLCCYAFYTFRMSSSRDQTFSDGMKVIRAATEIVASMAERGLPSIRTRVEELETRGRMIEQHQRKTGSVLEQLMSSGTVNPAAPSSTDPVANEAALLAARRAARVQS